MQYKQPKVVVFSVCFWKDQSPKLYPDWKKRVCKYVNHDRLFLAPGSYSDPAILKDDTEIVQIGIPNTNCYGRNWCYWHVGFMTAMYHLLLNVKDFDVAVHVQNSVLLGLDLNSYVLEFCNRSEILAAPKFTSEMGTYVETGLMMLKPEAVKQYAVSPLRPSLSDKNEMNVEEEAFLMFKDGWWNFLPETLTIRKKDDTVTDKGSGPFDLSDEEFLQSQIIMASNHAPAELVEKWIDTHKI